MTYDVSVPTLLNRLHICGASGQQAALLEMPFRHGFDGSSSLLFLSGQSEGLRHRHGEHVRVLGRKSVAPLLR